MKREILSFLETVWLPQKGRYGCVAWKDGEVWRQRFPHRDDVERGYQHRGRDLYFCPNLLSKPIRQNECALPSIWLYADLDEADPREMKIEPTMWWETSPGRWQCLWEMDRPLALKAHSALNQKMTYFCRADKNGWPMAKVLRIPGSVSTKWDEPFHITLDYVGGPRYDPRELWRIVRDTPVPSATWDDLKLDEASLELANKIMRHLPRELQAMIHRRKAVDRSAHVWQIACDLRDAGVKQQRAAAVMLASPVALDKYGGRIEQEAARVVMKAYAQGPKVERAGKKTSTPNGMLKWENANRLIAKDLPNPGFLVDGIWSTDAHGLIAGEHKTFKSLLAMDLGVSVATGTPFLGKFEIPTAGHVIYIQEENQASMVRDRLMKLTHSRRMHGHARMNGNSLVIQKPDELPMLLSNNAHFDLTDEDYLQELARQIKDNHTKLVILDPLYLMIPGVEENSASSMTPVLKSLLRIKQDLGVGILIIHHYKKQDRDNPLIGEDGRISGTSAFGRWYESLVLVEKGEEAGQLVMYPKHRLAPPGAPIMVEFDMGDMGDPRYQVSVVEAKEKAVEFYAELRDAVKESPGVSVAALGKMFGMRTERMRRKLEGSTHFRIEVKAGQSPTVYMKGR